MITEEIGFEMSSIHSWSQLKKLGGSSPLDQEAQLVSPDQIAT